MFRLVLWSINSSRFDIRQCSTEFDSVVGFLDYSNKRTNHRVYSMLNVVKYFLKECGNLANIRQRFINANRTNLKMLTWTFCFS